MSNPSHMSFIAHLEELRSRLWRAAFVYVVLVGVTFYFADNIFNLLQAPIVPYMNSDSFFMASEATSGWRVYMSIAFFSSFLLIIPYLFFELWRFATPGLMPHEKKFLLPISLLMSLFFIGGVYFAYRLALPFTLSFLITAYEGTQIHYLPNIESYFDFVLKTLIGFGLLFELPFLVLFLIQAGILKRETLARARAYIYVLAFVVGAILTPPDVMSQIAMAIPFILLFECGLVMGKFFKRKSNLQETNSAD